MVDGGDRHSLPTPTPPLLHCPRSLKFIVYSSVYSYSIVLYVLVLFTPCTMYVQSRSVYSLQSVRCIRIIHTIVYMSDFVDALKLANVTERWRWRWRKKKYERRLGLRGNSINSNTARNGTMSTNSQTNTHLDFTMKANGKKGKTENKYPEWHGIKVGVYSV